jgi:DNA/RNA endonuclease YhcR with UshA esterase domain
MKTMRMQKEEKIVVVLLFMALGSLAVAFWAFSPEEGNGDSADAKADSLLSLEGLILDMKPTNTGGNLILRLDSTTMPVFVPASSGARELQEQLHAGDRIHIRGTVEEFQGKEELKISRAADVQRLER